MAVFRVEKNRNYTVVANHCLQNVELSLKAMGLMMVLLSCSNDWNYTVKGLSTRCKDGVDGITTTMKELEQKDYIFRHRVRNEKGQLTTTAYTIYEMPQSAILEQAHNIISPPKSNKGNGTVFRVEKTKNYTVMSNQHLRNPSLSLKSKGLLSMMLSYREDWEYSIQGLTTRCRDGADSITCGIKELEEQGYVVRNRIRNEKGQLTSVEYIIYEEAQTIPPTKEVPKLETPKLEKPEQVKPVWEKPAQAYPQQENPVQRNTHATNTKKINTHQEISPPPYPLYGFTYDEPEEEDDDFDETIFQIKTLADLGNLTPSPGTYYRIKTGVQANLDYRALCFDIQEGTRHLSLDQLNMVVEIMTETLCSTKATIRISGEDHPAEMVKELLLSLDFTHVEYVLECLSQTTSHINHVKRYLLTLLYNAPSTIDSYYATMVNRHKLQA